MATRPATQPLGIVNARVGDSAPSSRRTSPNTATSSSSRSPSPVLRAAPADINNLLSGLGDSARRFTFNDSHFHHKNYRQRGLPLDKYIEYMDALGIRYTTLMPIPTSVSRVGGQEKLEESVVNCGCSPDYYLLADMIGKKVITGEQIMMCKRVIQLFLHTDVDDDTAFKLKGLTSDQRERIDPMITGLHIGIDNCSISLLEKLERHPKVFTGVGEITVHKEVVDDLLIGPWANLTTNRNSLLQLFRTCALIGMPVVLHCDVSVHGEGPGIVPRYLADLRKLFAHDYARKTTIVWAHAGGLGRFVNAPGGHVGVLLAMLDHPDFAHVHIDLSWKVVAERLTENAETIDQWAALINAHPTRFLFGSDALVPKDTDTWNGTFQQYANLFAKLTDDCVEKVCKTNYERVFVDAREKVRRFEQETLPGIMADIQTNFENWLYGRTTPPRYVAAGTLSAGTGTTSTSSTSSSTITGVPASLHTAGKNESAEPYKTGKHVEPAEMLETSDS